MHPIIEKLGTIGIVPVVVLDDESHALPLADALVAGGLSCVEVTFRTKAAAHAIERIASAVPAMHVGAGTVLTVEQVKTAVSAGAEFIISPGFSPKVVEYCISHSVPTVPGVLTPTEIEQALDYGLNVLKFFPVEAAGGLNYLKAVSAPFQKVKFMPSGGIDLSNLLSYLKFPGVHACGSSAMVKADLIARGGFDEIRRLTAEAVSTMLGFHVRHVGVNAADETHARSAVGVLADSFGFAVREAGASFFVAEQVEVTKAKRDGNHGHIAIGTNFIERAVASLERKGIRTRPETATLRDGALHTVYLDMDIQGFAVHLIQV